MPRKPMALASIITELKFLPRRKAILAGKTNDSRYQKRSRCWDHEGNSHTRYHVKENRHGAYRQSIYKSCILVKKSEYTWVLKKRKVRIKTTAAMIKSPMTCSWLMVTIEPKRYWSRLIELELFPLTHHNKWNCKSCRHENGCPNLHKAFINRT